MRYESPSPWSHPWLLLPSQFAHDVAPVFLPLFSMAGACRNKEWAPLEWRGMKFSNPMGIAGGVDKNGRSLKAWSQLGAGFVEVGTVTPFKQGPNHGKIMDRDIPQAALWNKMGFPNHGAGALKQKLKKMGKLPVPVFINIGKNRWTSNEEAHKDYISCIEQLHPFADVFVINISSPNTKGLRELLNADELLDFLAQITKKARRICPDLPILLKLSPDMNEETLIMALKESAILVDGWILTNTTKARFTGSRFPINTGGVSGRPLKKLSLQALKVALKMKSTHPEKLIVSCGGISAAPDVEDRLRKGADLVQVYSGLVFEGPGFFKKTLTQLQKKQRR